MTVGLKSRRESFHNVLMAVRGTLICSLTILFLDVVVDGSYIFTALVCPIWFLAALVRTMVRRPTLTVAAARILAPVVTGLLVIANSSLQNRVARDNAALVIQACE